MEVSYIEIKNILKKTNSFSRKDWTVKLDNSLWAYRITYKTPIRMTSFRLIYGKSFHLSIKIKLKDFWVIKALNLYDNAAEERRRPQLEELKELRYYTDDNVKLYKEQTKRLHVKHIIRREFK